MGVHVETRPSGRPHTPHAAHNHLQKLVLAHPVEAVGTVRRATLGEHGHERPRRGGDRPAPLGLRLLPGWRDVSARAPIEP